MVIALKEHPRGGDTETLDGSLERPRSGVASVESTIVGDGMTIGVAMTAQNGGGEVPVELTAP